MRLEKKIGLGLVAALALTGLFVLVNNKDSAEEPKSAEIVSVPACPNPPVTNVSSPDQPSDACVPSGQPSDVAFFDDFSWRMFIALVWPAQSGQRGVADKSAKLNGAGDRVFETWKPEWETFGRTPGDWSQFDSDTPCGPRPNNSIVVLASNTKFANLGQGGGLGQLVNALPSQSGKWVMYQTAFNDVTYNQIKNEKLYDSTALEQKKKTGLTMGVGAINLKSAWVEIDPEQRSKYYTRSALIFDPVIQKCREAQVSLVGLHIVAQTDRSKPYWIWSTFEHVDNVPTPEQLPMAFNANDGKAREKKDPNGGFAKTDWAKPVIYNVERTKQFDTSTEKTNQSYKNGLSGVWANYRLVMTHWPASQDPALKPPARRMKPTALSAQIAANPVFETFFPGSTCMGCHQETEETNFVWALETHVIAGAPEAALSPSPKKFTMTPAMLRLQTFMAAEIKKGTQEK